MQYIVHDINPAFIKDSISISSVIEMPFHACLITEKMSMKRVIATSKIVLMVLKNHLKNVVPFVQLLFSIYFFVFVVNKNKSFFYCATGMSINIVIVMGDHFCLYFTRQIKWAFNRKA